MLNPDFNDPVWIKQRQALWDKREQGMLDCSTKKERKWLRELYFTSEFEYGNKDKYGSYADRYSTVFFYSPVQHPQKWQKWFGEDLPRWLGDEYTQQPNSLMRQLAFTLRTAEEEWDNETCVELFRFCYGDKITIEPYSFLQFTFSRHPLLLANGSGAINLYQRWLQSILRWLEGYTADDQHFAVELLPIWLSSLEWVNPLYFQYALKESSLHEQADLQRLFIYCRDQAQYDLKHESSLLGEYAKKDTLSNDTGKRLAFLAHFKQVFDEADKPAELQALWLKSQQADFISAYQDPRVKDKDYSKPNKTKYKHWTRDKLATVFNNK
ncbi:MAG: hypothetical protein GY787_27925 [Alteromonadales bacterium]|nr:hypothetical protein [Alteromonadales bacterium]